MTREVKKTCNQAIERALELSQKSLEELIAKRQQIKTHYKATLDSLKAIQQDVENTVKENNAHITRLKRKLVKHKMIKAETEEFEPATTKCRKLAEECDTELRSIANLNFDWEDKLNAKISMKTLNDLQVSSIPAFDQGFRLNAVSDDHKMSLLSHLIFSVISQNGATIQVKSHSFDETDSYDETGSYDSSTYRQFIIDEADVTEVEYNNSFASDDGY